MQFNTELYIQFNRSTEFVNCEYFWNYIISKEIIVFNENHIAMQLFAFVLRYLDRNFTCLDRFKFYTNLILQESQSK